MAKNIGAFISVSLAVILFVIMGYTNFYLLEAQGYPDILRPFALFIVISSAILGILFITSAIGGLIKDSSNPKISDYDER